MSLIGAAAAIAGANKDAGEFRVHRRFLAAYNDPKAIRARAEAAGFNPLLFVGPGVGTYDGPGPGAFFSSAYANAGAALDEGLNQLARTGQQVSNAQLDQGRQRAAEVTALSQQNERMRQTLERISLRPKIPGIFGHGGAAGDAAAGISEMPSVTEALSFGSDYGRYSDPFAMSGTSTRVAYGNDGQMTATPSATDLDEIIPGVTVEAINRGKADGSVTPADMDNLDRMGRAIGDLTSRSLLGYGRLFDAVQNPSKYRVAWEKLPSLPSISFPSVSLPEMEWPEMPDFDLSRYGTTIPTKPLSERSSAVSRVTSAWAEWRKSKGY